MKYKPKLESKKIKPMKNLKIDKGIKLSAEEQKAFTVTESNVDVNIHHSIAEIKFMQTFVNNLTNPVECSYQYPVVSPFNVSKMTF